MKERISLKDVRVQNNLTQNEMAKIMGLSRSSIAKKESGQVSITIKDLRVLKENFNIDLENFAI